MKKSIQILLATLLTLVQILCLGYILYMYEYGNSYVPVAFILLGFLAVANFILTTVFVFVKRMYALSLKYWIIYLVPAVVVQVFTLIVYLNGYFT